MGLRAQLFLATLLAVYSGAFAVPPERERAVWRNCQLARLNPDTTGNLVHALFTPQEIGILSGEYSETRSSYRGEVSITVERRRSGEEPPLDVQVNRFSEFLKPHFDQILRSHRMTPERALIAARAGTLPEEVRTALRAPFLREGNQSGGFEVFHVSEAPIREYLGELVARRATESNPPRLKIVLGGTLPLEVRSVSQWVEEALRAEAKRQGVGDVEAWIRNWDVEIVGYSIQTQYLAKIREELTETPLPRPEWLRLEYIDLLNPLQIDRMKQERPDIVFTVASLYIGNYYGESRYSMDHLPEPLGSRLAELKKRIRDKDGLLKRYAQHVFEALPEGGLFVVERAPREDPEFPQFHVLPPEQGSRTRSGVMVKNTDPLNFPMSLLQAHGSSPLESLIGRTYQMHRNGARQDAAYFLYRTLAQYAAKPKTSPPPRFSLDTAIEILEAFPSDPGTPSGRMKERLSTLRTDIRAGRPVDLHSALQGLPAVPEAAWQPLPEKPGGETLGPPPPP